jgi:hypothetical protein
LNVEQHRKKKANEVLVKKNKTYLPFDDDRAKAALNRGTVKSLTGRTFLGRGGLVRENNGQKY